jgi:UDPglucose 6-dehydrogenase
MTIKIYGYGWVGKAMKTLFPDALIHDPAQHLINEQIADVAFVCVPTPNNPDGSLNTSIVESVVKNAKEDFIIIRSTVMPGTTKRLAEETEKEIVFQPEYLGETANHPMTDQHSRPFIILGGTDAGTRRAIELYQTAYNANIKIRQVGPKTAEVIKLTENRAIAFKVAQCQELYDVCQKAKVDYYEVVQAVYGDDPRFNLWFTFIYPDKRGFNSKCIPKDVYGWAAWAESVGYKPELTIKLLETNDALIRSNPVI